jgi:membrane-bound lytic murein transglycosylase A
MKYIKNLLTICLLLLVVGCVTVPKPQKLVLQPSSFSNFSGWEKDSIHDVMPALLKSCAKWSLQSYDKTIGRNPQFGKIADWRPACIVAQSIAMNDDVAVRQFFERNFTPHRVTNDGDPLGLFTGYYEIDLHGSLKSSSRYRYPLYKMPPDKKEGAPYYTRKQIDEGALMGKTRRLCWPEWLSGDADWALSAGYWSVT